MGSDHGLIKATVVVASVLIARDVDDSPHGAVPFRSGGWWQTVRRRVCRLHRSRNLASSGAHRVLLPGGRVLQRRRNNPARVNVMITGVSLQ